MSAFWSAHVGAAAGCCCRLEGAAVRVVCALWRVALGCCCQSGVCALERDGAAGVWLLVPLWGAAGGCCCKVLPSECCCAVCALELGCCVPLQGAAAGCCILGVLPTIFFWLLFGVSAGVINILKEREREGERERDTSCMPSPDGTVSALPSQAWCQEIGSGVVSMPQ